MEFQELVHTKTYINRPSGETVDAAPVTPKNMTVIANALPDYFYISEDGSTLISRRARPERKVSLGDYLVHHDSVVQKEIGIGWIIIGKISFERNFVPQE